MSRTYFKIAWRNLAKNKVFSFINVFGLSVGLTCCMLIGLYIYHEFSYDTQHKNSDQLYQLGTTFIRDGKEEHTGNTPAPMGRMMQADFPEIASTTRLMRLFSDDKTLLQYTGKGSAVQSIYETDGYLADSSFFGIFSYSFREGNPAVALQEPRSIVLSAEIADKLFGNQPALDKTIHISSSTNGDYDFKVTGVFNASAVPSHINARFFMTIKGGDMERYISNLTSLVNNNMFYTYFRLKDGADANRLAAKFPAFLEKNAGADLRAAGLVKKQFLTKVEDIHLRANISRNVTEAGSLTYLYILASIALFTLLIACINFMNLSTARSAKRAAEVGVRKVLGAGKASLVKQFLGESILLSIIAFLFAVCLAVLLLPLFAEVSGKQIAFSFDRHGWLMAVFLGLSLATGLIAGSYPAFYLSSFQPIRVLKGKITNTLAAVSLRKGLVVFQFVISVVLIVASVIINNQMNYMREKDLGFNKEQQIIIPMRSAASKKIYSSLKNELSRAPGIQSVGASYYYPGIFNPSDMPLYREGETMDESKKVYMNYVDEGFLQTLGLKPVAGRLFSPAFPADTNNRMVLNEEAIRMLGFKDTKDIAHKNVQIDWQGRNLRFEVVGIVKDFHFQDLHSAIEPYGFQLVSNGSYNYMMAHASTSDMAGTLKAIERSWNKLNPGEPFEYSFLDENFQKNYEADNRLASIVHYFTIVAILISCLGLFGLATFSAEQRTKEIGVRKVLGASVGSIVGLLSRDFLRLVFIAILIGSPIAWWAMNKWLQDFAYRTGIGWTVFLVTAGIALFIALFTISFQAVRAALMNPVKSLRAD